MTQDAASARDLAPLLERVVLTARRAVRVAYDSRYSHLGLSFTEGALMATLARFGPLTQRELAGLLYIGRAAAGQFVDRLETRGLVRRDADPDDRRVWIVSATEQAAEISQAALAIYFGTAGDLTLGLTDSEREALVSLLLQVQANAEGIASEQSA